MIENLNRVESENADLREQITLLQSQLEEKDRKVTEQEAELKILRNEREQFTEMQVRMEIQHKELGLIMREQKQNTKTSPRHSKKTAGSTDKVNASQDSKQS